MRANRLVAALLCFCLLLCAGCESVSRQCGDVVREFLDLLETGEYAAAYAYLASDCRNDSGKPRSGRISEEEFIQKYTGVFEILQIRSMAYDSLVVEAGNIIATASCALHYTSDMLGEVTENIHFSAIRQSGQWYIEWAPSMIFADMQWGDTVRRARLSALRGEITAEGAVLAKTAGTVTVYALVSKIGEQEKGDWELFAAQAARLLDMNPDKIVTALGKAYDDLAVLKTFYSDELSASTAEQLLALDGVGIDYGNYGTQREYPYGSLMAHTLGYVGAVDEKQLDTLNQGRTDSDGLYNTDSIVGRLGIERQYETTLRGKDGTMVFLRTADGTVRRTFYREDAQNGEDVRLTINIELQEDLEDLLELALYGDTTAAAVVVMDPLTGKVDAIASYPSYDLNLFTRGISKTDYNKLLEQPNKPLINRATQGLYPPGSTMKAFTAAAALDYGTLDANYAFDTSEIKEDYWRPKDYGEWIWTPIKRTHINYPIDGPLNMRKALIHSDNIYFANAALLMGWEPFQAYMTKIGFTESIPFDIGVATPQLINEDTDVDYKMLADSGYGQGEILVTPLQLAAMFSSFANNGNIVVPRLIEGFYQESGFRYRAVTTTEPSIWKTGVLSENAIAQLTPMLEDVVDPSINGTGRNLKVRSCKVAAKTGTAEIGSDKSREISWFVGYRVNVPAEQARLVLVMVEIPTGDAELTSIKFELARPMLELD